MQREQCTRQRIGNSKDSHQSRLWSHQADLARNPEEKVSHSRSHPWLGHSRKPRSCWGGCRGITNAGGPDSRPEYSRFQWLVAIPLPCHPDRGGKAHHPVHRLHRLTHRSARCCASNRSKANPADPRARHSGEPCAIHQDEREDRVVHPNLAPIRSRALKKPRTTVSAFWAVG